MNTSSSNLAFQLILIVILTLINAFFAAAEMAIVSLNKNKIKTLAEQGDKKAQLVLNLTREPTKFLSTIQVGITLASFFNSASAAMGLSDDLGGMLAQWNIPYSKQIALVGVTLILSYITLVFGELFPKRIALSKSETIAMFSVRPIVFISKIMVPFIKLLSVSTNILITLVGLNREGLDEKVSEEEIKSLLEVGQEQGVFNPTEKEMINSIFAFDDKLACEVMTPRPDVYLINMEHDFNEYLDELLVKPYSRIPVYEGNSDNIKGILYMKDLLVEARKVGFDQIDIRKMLHVPYFVPETKKINDLFRELQIAKKHIAILINEYGGFSGIVSMEDLIEEIMGEIDDEYDASDPDITQLDDYNYIVSGRLSIESFNDYFQTKIKDKDYDTMGGFIVDLLGHIPTEMEEKPLEYQHLSFEIIEVKKKRIKKMKVTVSNEKENGISQNS